MKLARPLTIGLAAAALVGLVATLQFPSASAQLTGQAGALVGGLGTQIFSTLMMPSGTIMVGQSTSSNPIAAVMSGDCTLNAAGAITCTKTSGTALGTAAAANTGTSGSNVALMSTANTWAAAQTFAAHQIAGVTSPVPTACGTSPVIVGDDKDFLITMGTGTPTGCVATFAVAYTSAPLCTVTWAATPLLSQSYAVSNLAVTLTQTATSSNKVNVHCAAQSGG
jgi:hypothetical protein